MTSCTVSTTRMAVLPGMYDGASFGRKISVPKILPTPYPTMVIALIVF